MDIPSLESLLSSGTDTALLRFTLGSAHFRHGNLAAAVPHFARAVALDPEYSAAWKLYARCLVETGQHDTAAGVLAQGLAVARQRGDMQAVREMEVWQRRLQKG